MPELEGDQILWSVGISLPERLVSRVKIRGHRKYLIEFFVRECYRHRGREEQETVLQRAISLHSMHKSSHLSVPRAQLYVHGGTILGKDKDAVAVKRFTCPLTNKTKRVHPSPEWIHHSGSSKEFKWPETLHHYLSVVRLSTAHKS